jgi:hypothetical protein
MAHPDLDELVNALFSFAHQMLADHGEFFPFGASMSNDGEIAYSSGLDGEEEQPDSTRVLELLLQGFAGQAASGHIRAAGVCMDVRVVPPDGGEPVDAMCAQLEHEQGEAVDVFLPYRLKPEGGLEYDDLFAGPGDSRVFPGGHLVS